MKGADVKIGALYGRVSDEESANKEHGSTEQQEHLGLQQARYLTEVTGNEHSVKYMLIEEKAVSGGTTNRPKYQELLSLIKDQKIDFIVAKEVSRLNRSTIDFIKLVQLCKENNVALHIRGLNLDPKNPMHDAMFKILAVIAELERKMIQERTRSSIRSAMINNAKIHGGPVPLGFDRDPNRAGYWIPNKDELRVVEFLMKTFNETLSYKETLRIAKNKGMNAKDGKPFSKNSIKRLLTNRKYIGRMKVPGEGEETWVDLPHGTVVPVELFNEVQQNVLKIGATPKNLRHQKRVYILSGLLCFEDGSTFHGVSGRGRVGEFHYYYVNSPNKVTLRAEEIESAVFDFLRIYENDEKMLKHAGEMQLNRDNKFALLQQQLESLRRQLKALDQDEDKLPDLLSSLKGGSEQVAKWLDKQLKRINGKREEMNQNIRVLEKESEGLKAFQVTPAMLKKSLKVVFDRLKTADPLLQRSIVRQLFKKITVHLDNRIVLEWAIPAGEVSCDIDVRGAVQRGEWGG